MEPGQNYCIVKTIVYLDTHARVYIVHTEHSYNYSWHTDLKTAFILQDLQKLHAAKLEIYTSNSLHFAITSATKTNVLRSFTEEKSTVLYTRHIYISPPNQDRLVANLGIKQVSTISHAASPIHQLTTLSSREWFLGKLLHLLCERPPLIKTTHYYPTLH